MTKTSFFDLIWFMNHIEAIQSYNQSPTPDKRVLAGMVRETILATVSENKFLDQLEAGELDTVAWKNFATQRYVTALPFSELLRVGVAAAQASGDEALARVLAANLRDELGIDAAGVVHTERAHETWRKNFYAALGVTETTLTQVVPLSGTARYLRVMTDLQKEADSLVIAGALLALEGSIPHEFRRVQIGRDKNFAAQFVAAPVDTPAVLARKAAARQYIDDHIIHDAGAHYPDLLHALEKYVDDAAALARLTRGATMITRAKKAFYDCLIAAKN